MQAFGSTPQSLLMILLLLSCTRPPEPEPLPEAAPVSVWNEKEPDTCGVAPFAHLVGQPVGQIHTAGLPGIYRVVSPGALVSQEYNAHRIDVQVDGAGIVTELTCG
jgi:Peptidase inhibitor I78 family